MLEHYSSEVMERLKEAMKLLKFNKHLIQTNGFDSFFECFRCPNSDTFFHKSDHFNKHLIRFKDRVLQIYPSNAYTLRETIFDNFDVLNVPYTEEGELISNVAIFDFETKCVLTDELEATETTTLIE